VGVFSQHIGTIGDRFGC